MIVPRKLNGDGNKIRVVGTSLSAFRQISRTSVGRPMVIGSLCSGQDTRSRSCRRSIISPLTHELQNVVGKWTEKCTYRPARLWSGDGAGSHADGRSADQEKSSRR